MKRHLALLAACVPLGLALNHASAETGSWIFRPSYYSHEPASGGRTEQFAQPAPSLAPIDSTYMQSGYRQNHTSIQAGDGADHLHIVETWGRGDQIRPYGEWQYPFRAGATPYGPWGNPQGPWTTPYGSWANPYGLMRPRTPYGPAATPYGPTPGYRASNVPPPPPAPGPPAGVSF